MRRLTLRKESWPLKETFVISRMVQESGEVAVVEIEEDGHKGRGECDCSDSFDPTRPAVLEQIETQRQAIEQGDDDWECRILSTEHLLAKKKYTQTGQDNEANRAWERCHRDFHTSLIEACNS